MPDGPGHVQSGKAQFGHIYNQADPRGYFQTLGDLEYRAPAHGGRVFDRIVQRWREHLDRQDVVVLDLCCSYGINAALLNHDVTFDALCRRYSSSQLATLSTDELVVADRAFFDEHRRPDPVQVLGIDVADQAVAYARGVGLHWAGSSENLELEDASAALAQLLVGVDLITVTGGIGYVSEHTFDRLLRHTSLNDGCWVAAFALRWIQYERIAEVLAHYGLATERLAGHTFRQRRFADDIERDYVLGELDRMGIDPSGKETEGWYHSYFYLSCPAEQAPPSLPKLLSDCLD